MFFSPSDFLYNIKQLVTGTNGFLRGTSGAKSYDGGIRHEVDIPLEVVADAGLAAITDNTGGTSSSTFAAITAPAANATTSLTADMTAVKNALASIAARLNAIQVGVDTNSFPAINVSTGTTAIGDFEFPIPRDYDEASDSFVVRVQIAVNATDVAVPIKLQGTMNWLVPGSNVVHPVNASGGSISAVAVTATLPFTTTQNLGSSQTTYEINFSGSGLMRDDVVSVVLALNGTTSAGPAFVYGVEILYDSTIVSYNQTDTTGIDGILSEYGNELR